MRTFSDRVLFSRGGTWSRNLDGLLEFRRGLPRCSSVSDGVVDGILTITSSVRGQLVVFTPASFVLFGALAGSVFAPCPGTHILALVQRGRKFTISAS